MKKFSSETTIKKHNTCFFPFGFPKDKMKTKLDFGVLTSQIREKKGPDY